MKLPNQNCNMISQQTVVGNSFPDVLELLEICPKWSELLRLPWWYNIHIVNLRRNIRRSLKEIQPGPFCLEHARLLAACYNDRKYIDTVLKYMTFDIEPGHEKKWIQAYLDVGLTLCDLGYSSEGITFLEKAIALENCPDMRNNYILLLCYRLSKIGRHEKVIELAKAILDNEPKNSVAKMLFERANINTGKFGENDTNITELVTEYPKAFGFLSAELQFALNDFKAASDAFDIYEINRRLSFWLPEYDYKKAIAYYYSGQQDKFQAQVLKMKRRMRWDKFYRLDDIENTGIKKVPTIDNLIQFEPADKTLFDTDKIWHYSRTIYHIARLCIYEYWRIICFWRWQYWQ